MKRTWTEEGIWNAVVGPYLEIEPTDDVRAMAVEAWRQGGESGAMPSEWEAFVDAFTFKAVQS